MFYQFFFFKCFTTRKSAFSMCGTCRLWSYFYGGKSEVYPPATCTAAGSHVCLGTHEPTFRLTQPFNSVQSDATSWQQIYIHKYVITLCSKSKKKGNQRKSIKTYFKFWDGKWWILIWVTSYELPCVLPLLLLFFHMLCAHVFIFSILFSFHSFCIFCTCL